MPDKQTLIVTLVARCERCDGKGVLFGPEAAAREFWPCPECGGIGVTGKPYKPPTGGAVDLLRWALPYCPKPLPSMEGGEYARRYAEAQSLTATQGQQA